jgi:hypothetical protein
LNKLPDITETEEESLKRNISFKRLMWDGVGPPIYAWDADLPREGNPTGEGNTDEEAVADLERKFASSPCTPDAK